MFHIIDGRDRSAWNSIRTLVLRHDGPTIASQNRPPDLDPSRWTRNLSSRRADTGGELAEMIAAALLETPAPRFVMVDELHTTNQQKIGQAARILRARYPELRGRWGVYIVNGTAVSYARLNLPPFRSIDSLLGAGAVLAAEMYPRYRDYRLAGRTAFQRDAWLEDFFRGSQGAFPQARFAWLVARRKHLRSDSTLTMLFGVTDLPPVDFARGIAPATFVDRLFYVWATRSRFRSALFVENGGPGSYKWDRPAMSNSSRDLAFLRSFEHYCVVKRTHSKDGPVPV